MYNKILNQNANLLKIILEEGGQARIVGGCVRDALLGKKIQDIDVATNLLPQQVVKILKKKI